MIPPALFQEPRRRGGLGFTITVSVALVLGAVAIALVLLTSGAPDAVAIGLVLASLPVGPLVACYLWLDRYEPEPLGLMAFAFGWGALVATTIALLLQAVEQFVNDSSELWSGVVVAPLTEEAAKGLFVMMLLWARRHELDGILDGLVYAGLVGVGFAFTENILYFASAYMGGPDFGPGGFGAATGLFIVRGVFSPFAHPLFTSMIGIAAGIAVSTRSRSLRLLAPVLGYLAAVSMHAAWNGSAFLDGGRLFLLVYIGGMVPGFLALLGFALWTRYREGTMLVRALTDAAQRGFVGHAEVPWLVRLPARRTARRYAANTGGPWAERAMKEYQEQATDLAYLHNRYLRGTAPRDFAERGSFMVHRLTTLRPYIMFPQVVGRHLLSPGGPGGPVGSPVPPYNGSNRWEGGR